MDDAAAMPENNIKCRGPALGGTGTGWRLSGRPLWLDVGRRLVALLNTLASHPVQPARVAAIAVGRHVVTGGSHRLMHGQSGHRGTALSLVSLT